MSGCGEGSYNVSGMRVPVILTYVLEQFLRILIRSTSIRVHFLSPINVTPTLLYLVDVIGNPLPKYPSDGIPPLTLRRQDKLEASKAQLPFKSTPHLAPT